MKENEWGNKMAISDFQNLGFSKNILKNAKFWKILNIFGIFKFFQKTGIYV